MSIYGNAAGGFGFPKTFVLTDENGNEMTGVIVGEEQIFTATPADVRIGKTFASDEGVATGENTITYRTLAGRHIIMPGGSFAIPLSEYNQYNYTQFQCIVSKFNTSISDSVYTDKVSMNDLVYNVNSLEQISSVTKSDADKAIELNIVNNTTDKYILRFMTYKEEEI